MGGNQHARSKVDAAVSTGDDDEFTDIDDSV
jgi:hypothetical protein